MGAGGIYVVVACGGTRGNRLGGGWDVGVGDVDCDGKEGERVSHDEVWTSEDALNQLLAENWRAQQAEVMARKEAARVVEVEEIRRLLHVDEVEHVTEVASVEWPDDFDYDDYQKWLDEQNAASRRAHDEWLDELYAAEELERAEREQEERRNDH